MVFPVTAHALEPQKKLSQYVFDQWTDRDGLPQLSVYTVLQMRDGYLWLGTQEGLLRFDGMQFELFDRRSHPDLVSHFIMFLHQDRFNRLWAGTSDEGVLCYNQEELKVYTSQQGLPSNAISGITEDDKGELSVFTDKGTANVFIF